MSSQLPLDELSLVFARLKGLLLTEEKVDRAVQLLAEAAKDAIPGTSGAGVSLLNDQGRRTSRGATDAIVEQADVVQYELGEGPCLTAWASDETVVVEDVASDGRWPLWSQAVASLPVRSVVSTPLRTETGSLGALKIYAAVPSVYDAGTGLLLEKFAMPAATLLANIQGRETPQRISEALIAALAGRDSINRACGVLMERENLGAEEAMQELLRLARTQKSPLHQLSADLVQAASAGGKPGPG
ncbi:GAF and ANTAR domain-containing protein [Arthrobacter sp. ISL-28]|uniref:GAF and ANTAR domain-containing protein n=1 Tax=Arthrobacter sp. ISL-28 TaxID=2819108 RepID=UPI001BE6B298|nr:GAF and ANTAR domain-containing protein [Arthrobacter sp. ISL-28]MBT2519607.1 GAF and ANTAR domain-containing protein [Arthrobacter sp. ISL-28]